jgi:hypothetical protein
MTPGKEWGYGPGYWKEEGEYKYGKRLTPTEYMTAWRSANLERVYDGLYGRLYGITSADYDARLAEQGGVCALCGNPPKVKRLHVDHDHKTGRVRGILCSKCNQTLHFIEDGVWLSSALKYLCDPWETTGEAPEKW